MNRYLPLLLAGLLAPGLPLQAQTLTETAQLRLGKLLPTDSVRIFIEYPEYEALGSEAVKALRAKGFVPQPHVQLHVSRAVMRGETVADVSFVPVVERNGRWLRLKSYELKYENVGRKLSPALRSVVASAQRVEAASRYAAHSVLAEGKWVKIRVKEEGIYQLTDAQLRSMGFADPSRVKLYGYGGRLQPDVFDFSGDDGVIDDLNEVPLYRRNGSVLFFAEGVVSWSENGRFSRNTFSEHSCYFLTEGDSPAAFVTLDTPTVPVNEVEQVTAHALNDNDAYAWYGGGRDFYDSKDTQQGGQQYKLSLPGHVGGACKVYYDVSAMSSVGSTKAVITGSGINESVQATIGKIGDGESARGYRGSFTAELEEEARINVATTNTGRLNYLCTDFQQKLSTAYTTSAFTAGQSRGVQLNVAAATANTRVWQLGNARSTVAELPGTLEGDTYKALASDGNQRFVLVDVSKTYSSPEVVGAVENQDLHADTKIDYVIIVPASGKLTEQAERLAEAHRQKSGLRVKVVRADQLYNEFSSGTPDAAAYRRYLKMLYDRAATTDDAPKYLLLFGDCVYDNRMITSEWKSGNPDDFLLAYERNDMESYNNSGYSIGTLHSYVTDDYFAFMDDGEGTMPELVKIDLGVGRFICHTSEQAQWLVDNTLRYMNNERTGVWKNRMWCIGDSGDDNLHMEDALEVAEQVKTSANESFLQRFLFQDVYAVTQGAQGATYPEATKKLKTNMQQGALLLNYNGHGSPDRLSHRFLLTAAEMKENVSASLPLWVFASCEITPYDQVVDDLGRNALYAPQGPAVAVLCASRSVYANSNLSLNKRFVNHVFAKNEKQQRNTLGDALRLAKCELIDASSDGLGTDRTINKLKYALLGDPAIVLSYPDEGIVVDSINGKAITSDTFSQLKVGNVVRFSGYVNADPTATVPDATFNGTLTASVFAPKQSLTCKGYGNSYADPIVYSDYTQMVFEGEVEVKDGRFDINFMVPRGIPFSEEKALLSLYAVNAGQTQELSGRHDGFCLNGTAETEVVDSIGPDVFLYLNSPDFPSGGTVGTDAVFYAAVTDSSAISMVSGNLGYDMELWFDSDPSTTVVTNDHFSFEYGSYSKGLVEYPLQNLTPGRHTLAFRVRDVYGNVTLSTLAFRVKEGGAAEFDVTASSDSPVESTRFVTSFVNTAEVETEVTTEVYNVAGMRVWHGTAKVPAGSNFAALDWGLTDYGGNRLERGVYMYRSRIGKSETKTKKMILR